MERIRWRFLTLLFAVLQLFFLELRVSAASLSSASSEAKRSLGPENQDLTKRAGPPPPDGFYPVLGAGGRCYPRRNIEVLRSRYPDEFNMLILALYDLQRNPSLNIDLSWFGIGGIHGAPYIPWQQPPNNGPFNGGLGYAVHGSPLFPLWHRAYVLLFEQVLHERAVELADRFLDGNGRRYRNAANRLRLPYMDWSDPAYSGRIPTSVSSPQISVISVSDSGRSVRVTLDNPLYRYNFRPEELSQLPGIWGTYEYTTRAPQSVSPRPVSGDSLVNLGMISSFISRRQNTFNLFTRTTFNIFSAQCEAMNNGIHVMIGWGVGGSTRGHMASTTAAAFDPIFWLHHANVDRLTAMYQVIYPNNLLTPATAAMTFGRLVPGDNGFQDTLQTMLYPFRKADGSMYTGSDFTSGSRGIWRYNYGYPEIPCNSRMTRAQLSSNVRQAVNRLYRPAGVPLRRRQNETLPEPPAGPVPGEESGYPPSESEIGMVRTEYSLRMFMDLTELFGIWTCHIFLGDVPSSLDDYLSSPNHCGIFAPFIPVDPRMESTLYSYDFALTDKLLSLRVSSNETVKYLTDNLKYVIITETGLMIDASSLKTFKAGICTWQGTYGERDSDKLATFGDCTVLYKITEGMPGGVDSAAELELPKLLDGTVVDLNMTLEHF